MSDLHNQDLVAILENKDRIAAGKAGQEGAKNIYYENLREQIKDEIIDGFFEPIILRPATQPAIVLGTPNYLTLDLQYSLQAVFEPRLDTGNYTINVDFEILLSNFNASSNAIELKFSFTGTLIIQFPANTIAGANPSGESEWDETNQLLTVTAVIDSQLSMWLTPIKSTSKIDLKVGGIAT